MPSVNTSCLIWLSVNHPCATRGLGGDPCTFHAGALLHPPVTAAFRIHSHAVKLGCNLWQPSLDLSPRLLYYYIDNFLLFLLVPYLTFTILSVETQVRFIVMNNVFRTDLAIHRKYDLKGSTLGRTSLLDKTAVSAGTILKDLDLDTVFKLEEGWPDRYDQPPGQTPSCFVSGTSVTAEDTCG